MKRLSCTKILLSLLFFSIIISLVSCSTEADDIDEIKNNVSPDLTKISNEIEGSIRKNILNPLKDGMYEKNNENININYDDFRKDMEDARKKIDDVKITKIKNEELQEKTQEILDGYENYTSEVLFEGEEIQIDVSKSDKKINGEYFIDKQNEILSDLTYLEGSILELTDPEILEDINEMENHKDHEDHEDH